MMRKILIQMHVSNNTIIIIYIYIYIIPPKLFMFKRTFIFVKYKENYHSNLNPTHHLEIILTVFQHIKHNFIFIIICIYIYIFIIICIYIYIYIYIL